ncbi:DMT family transporter [Streptomyces sp. 8L]|uniref:DMT family transporter n=1 Tax=Streptomyces sp. 8L TaxID=2877242 RepID=UPI001CD64E88|nr:DMT family transporter [Streptomyces sp. 8L]MCA1217566.1 DMT family transporter [Streptomyces sp. 8L]
MTAAILAAAGLSLVSAVAYAVAAVAQERLAARTGRERAAAETGGGLPALLRRGAWWWAVGLNVVGAMLHVAALAFGPLTVVQPLGALTLVAAVPLGAYRAGRKVSRGEWTGTACTLVGLAAILLAAAGSGPSEALSLPQALGVSATAAALAAVLVFSLPGARPGLRHATASGVASGVASALTQTVTVTFTAHGGGRMPLWGVAVLAVLVAVFACGGLLLAQASYRGGLGAPLSLLTLANPVAASAIGLILLGERLQGGPLGIAAAGVGAVLAARGVVLLTRAADPGHRPSSANVPEARPGPAKPVNLPALPAQPVKRRAERA